MFLALSALLGALLTGGSASPGPAATAAGSCWFGGERADLAKRVSPLDSAVAMMGDAEIKVCYGRPSARGRVIMGGLVPFGEPWRLGANEAATLHVPVAVRFGNVSLKPGIYSLYAIPGAKTWQVVVNDSATRWGIPINAAVRGRDVGAVTVPTQPTDSLVETLTMRLDPAPDGTLTFVFEWEHMRARVTIERAK